MYIFANDKKDVFLSSNCKETNNINLAICFNSIDEALTFEDNNSDDILFLNYLYEIKESKLIKVDV